MLVPEKTYGKWTVIREAPRQSGARVMLCRCECGFEKTVQFCSLRQNRSTGCLKCRPKKHGKSRDRMYLLCNIARSRAKRAGIPFELDWREMTLPSECPLLGIPLIWSNRRMHPNNPSLDRLDPKKGYTKDNVWIVSWRANALKHNATLAELETLVRNLRTKAPWWF